MQHFVRCMSLSRRGMAITTWSELHSVSSHRDGRLNEVPVGGTHVDIRVTG
jgi:hypothetical protein